jgi:predicted nucleic acid-binding Zn ribbon protein
MKKILYTQFQNIDDVIANLAQKKEIKRAITRSNLYKFWDKVVGEKFSQHSKPYSMLKGSVMVVACETPIVAQELTLRKMQILSKLKPYVQSLNMKLTDIRFDPKKWMEN